MKILYHSKIKIKKMSPKMSPKIFVTIANPLIQTKMRDFALFRGACSLQLEETKLC